MAEEVAVFGGGCFWCIEAVFNQIKGVKSAISGYAGGPDANPTYKEVCGGSTGHAEVVQVTFDNSTVSYPDLLEIFWRVHDPTTLNRQGNDRGTQYRSVIYCYSDAQHQAALASKAAAEEAKLYNNAIVTEIVHPAPTFYPAEDYHQNYFRNNPSAGYCSYVIAPKVKKFQQLFREKLKTADELKASSTSSPSTDENPSKCTTS